MSNYDTKKHVIYLNKCDKYGYTPLQSSILDKKYSITFILLAYGAKPNQYLTLDNVWRNYFHLNYTILAQNVSASRLLCLYGACMGSSLLESDVKASKTLQIIAQVKNDWQPLGMRRIQEMQKAEIAVNNHNITQAVEAYQDLRKTLIL